MTATSPAPASTPSLSLSRIGQIAIVVHDVERATAYYRDVLGMRFLFAFPGLAFFDCALLDQRAERPALKRTIGRPGGL